MNDLLAFLRVGLPVCTLVTKHGMKGDSICDAEMKGGVYFTRDQALSPNTCKEFLSPPQTFAI